MFIVKGSASLDWAEFNFVKNNAARGFLKAVLVTADGYVPRIVRVDFNDPKMIAFRSKVLRDGTRTKNIELHFGSTILHCVMCVSREHRFDATVVCPEN